MWRWSSLARASRTSPCRAMDQEDFTKADLLGNQPKKQRWNAPLPAPSCLPSAFLLKEASPNLPISLAASNIRTTGPNIFWHFGQHYKHKPNGPRLSCWVSAEHPQAHDSIWKYSHSNQSITHDSSCRKKRWVDRFSQNDFHSLKRTLFELDHSGLTAGRKCKPV